jgi:deaminated glutathione amidase
MRIAAVQMVSTPSVATNLEAARRLVARAAGEGAGMVVLPEYFCLLGKTDRDKLSVAETPGDGPIQRMLAQTARAHRLWLIGGTLPLKAERASAEEGDPADRVMNANLVFSPEGELAARYDKMHLFAYDNGRERYDEARVLRPGGAVASVQAGALKVGLSICYDVRFPELYRALGAEAPCDLIAVPAAFTHTTGEAHWELLLRARAVENQAYVIAPAQGGRHVNGRRTWGHSMIVDPWGVVLASLDEGEGVVLAEVDPARIASVRAQLPALGHRRL